MADHALLDARVHGNLRVSTARSAAMGDGIMSCLVVPAEFRQVQSEYVILFRLDTARDAYGAVALFGFEAGENLYVEEGRWDARNLPLAMAVQPFLIGSSGPGATDKQVHVDLDSPRLTDSDGVRLFDQDGRPTPLLEDVAEKLGRLDAGFQQSTAFFAALRRHNLLEPMSLEITLQDGSTNRLAGYHALNEERVRTLHADALGELHAADHLLPIFMAMASLGNIGALVARKNRRNSDG